MANQQHGRPAGRNLPDSPEEIRVPRSEETLESETRQREAGQVRARKSVRTDKERFVVPRKREEVGVERVAVEGEAREAPDARIGEDEMVMQVFEEEIVVSKRVVLKEEIRLRKVVVEEEEIIEEDVRREVVEIEDETERDSERGNE